MKQCTVKEEDSTTYTSAHGDNFSYGTEEEETDEGNVEPAKKNCISEEEGSTIGESSATSVLDCEGSCSRSVQSRVDYFEHCFKQVC